MKTETENKYRCKYLDNSQTFLLKFQTQNLKFQS